MVLFKHFCSLTASVSIVSTLFVFILGWSVTVNGFTVICVQVFVSVELYSSRLFQKSTVSCAFLHLLFTHRDMNCSLSLYCISSRFISYSRSIFTQQSLGLRITSYSPGPAVLSQRLHSNLRNVHIMFILLPGKQRERQRQREREREKERKRERETERERQRDRERD